jgi:Ran GTPase-activating protein (RanGAP) involved in mRNA processing and transport
MVRVTPLALAFAPLLAKAKARTYHGTHAAMQLGYTRVLRRGEAPSELALRPLPIDDAAGAALYSFRNELYTVAAPLGSERHEVIESWLTEEDDDAKAKGVEIWTEDQFIAAASDGKQKDASSAEEQEEAPTAKEAKHDEQIRVRARDGEEVILSRDAARLMGTLKDLMDLATSEDGIYPMPTIMASTFQMVCKLNDPDYTWPSSDEQSLSQLIQLIEDALYLDASKVALKHIQRAIASRLNGKCTPELCALLGAVGDFGSADEHTASIAEPAFAPENFEAPQQPASSTPSPALLQQPSFSADAMEAALGLVDVATLVELKGVTRFWRALARRVLCTRLCRRDWQPVPTQLAESTDLDVEQLIEAGRPGDAAVAGRLLPGLARLHGYGYVVDVAAVRAANLQNSLGDRTGMLRDTAKAVLNSCISGEGEPPLRLTIAAIACAGSGVICGIPVQRMREDSVTTLDLSGRGLHVHAAMLVAYLLPATSVLKNCKNLLKNRYNLGIQPAMMLAKIGAERGIMLSGIMLTDQKEADLSCQYLQPADAILIASDLKFMAVLTSVDLRANSIGDDGAEAIAEALKVNAVLTFLRLDDNKIGDDGAKAIAEALKVNAVLTFLRLDDNKIGDDGAKAIAEALKVNAVLKNCNLLKNRLNVESATMLAKIGRERGIMLSGMKRDQTEVSFSGWGLQPADAILIASDLQSMAVLKNCNLLKNRLDVESATMLAKIGRERGIMLSGMKRDQTEVSFSGWGLQPADAILIGSDLQSMAVLKNCNLLKNNLGNQPAMMLAKIGAEKGIMLSGMKRDQTEVSFFNEGFQPADAILIASDLKFMAVLTTLNLWSNSIGDEGAMAIAEALKVNAVVTTLALGNNNIGNNGAKAIAEALKVNVVLTKLVLWEERNCILGDAGKRAFQDAVKGRSGFKLYL